MAAATIQDSLAEFRAQRREFEARLRALDERRWTAPLEPGGWSAREVVIHIAAWLAEACERIPALLAGAAPRDYDVDSFNATAVRAAEGRTAAQVLGAYKRAADRFETIAADLRDGTLDEEPDARAWLHSAARAMIREHIPDIDRAMSL